MAKLGRPPVLDEIKRREICAILAVGSTRRVAAKYVGCSVRTIRETAARDPRFYHQLLQAESQHEVRYLQCILAASKKEQYWRAAAWALERKYPARYAARPAKCVTPEQISEMLRQFAGVLVAAVPDPQQREAIMDRLKRIVEDLRAEAKPVPLPPADPE